MKWETTDHSYVRRSHKFKTGLPSPSGQYEERGHGNEVCVHNPIWDENYIFKKNVNTITVPHSRVCMCDNQRHNRIWLLSNRSQTIPAVSDWNSILPIRIVYCSLFTVLETKNITASIRSKHKQLIIVQTKFRSSNQAKLENCQIGYSMWKWRVAVNGGPQVSGYNCSASIFSPFCFHYFLGFLCCCSRAVKWAFTERNQTPKNEPLIHGYGYNWLRILLHLNKHYLRWTSVWFQNDPRRPEGELIERKYKRRCDWC